MVERSFLTYCYYHDWFQQYSKKSFTYYNLAIKSILSNTDKTNHFSTLNTSIRFFLSEINIYVYIYTLKTNLYTLLKSFPP